MNIYEEVKRYDRPIYNIGDTVVVVDHPVECPFSWIEEMDDFCGKVATVEDVYFSDDRQTEVYRIDVDDGFYSWSWNCFEPKEKEFEDDLDTDEFLSILAN